MRPAGRPRSAQELVAMPTFNVGVGPVSRRCEPSGWRPTIRSTDPGPRPRFERRISLSHSGSAGRNVSLLSGASASRPSRTSTTWITAPAAHASGTLAPVSPQLHHPARSCPGHCWSVPEPDPVGPPLACRRGKGRAVQARPFRLPLRARGAPSQVTSLKYSCDPTIWDSTASSVAAALSAPTKVAMPLASACRSK